mmetsp:Transcript_19348/g.58180  ORF Transcript_19348/g.58180 Transcript_19348/m.58180 type:complete len:292 (+) Transcript_19348:118-993(+)
MHSWRRQLKKGEGCAGTLVLNDAGNPPHVEWRQLVVVVDIRRVASLGITLLVLCALVDVRQQVAGPGRHKAAEGILGVRQTHVVQRLLGEDEVRTHGQRRLRQIQRKELHAGMPLAVLLDDLRHNVYTGVVDLGVARHEVRHHPGGIATGAVDDLAYPEGVHDRLQGRDREPRFGAPEVGAGAGPGHVASPNIELVDYGIRTVLRRLANGCGCHGLAPDGVHHSFARSGDSCTDAGPLAGPEQRGQHLACDVAECGPRGRQGCGLRGGPKAFPVHPRPASAIVPVTVLVTL